MNWWKGKPSRSISCTRKQQPRFYWSCSSVAMNDATPLTNPLAHEQNSIFKCKQHTCTLHDPWGPEKYDYTMITRVCNGNSASFFVMQFVFEDADRFDALSESDQKTFWKTVTSRQSRNKSQGYEILFEGVVQNTHAGSIALWRKYRCTRHRKTLALMTPFETKLYRMSQMPLHLISQQHPSMKWHV